MANKRITMTIQETILQLKRSGLSKRQVAKILKRDRATIGKYWEQTVGPILPIEPSWVTEINWKKIEDEIQNKVSRKILYEELRLVHKLPSYSNFSRYVAIKCNQNKSKDITIHIPRTAGESIEVDYSGDTWQIINPATGELVTVYLFVGTLGYSSHFFAEFTFSERLEDFIESHCRMFSFFGGVAKYLIPDNCKTAVTLAEKYDPELNQTYHDMASHYGAIVDPARVRRPQDKPHVEASVKVLQNDFLPRIRNKTYTAISELNRDLMDYIKTKSLEEMKDRGQSRHDLFQKEKAHLLPLPVAPYEIFHFKKAKVHTDCHIQHNKNFYSVPYRYVGQEVSIRHNQRLLTVYVNSESIATHTVYKGHGHYSTNESHYPEKKIIDLHMTLLSLKKEASKVGPNTSILIERLFSCERHPLKNVRKVQGILSLAKKHESKAIEYAAESALNYNKLFYRYIKLCTENYREPTSKILTRAPIRSSEFICLQGGKP